MNHKRHRPKRQRAGCTCGTKEAKVNGISAFRGGKRSYQEHGATLRLRERAREAA